MKASGIKDVPKRGPLHLSGKHNKSIRLSSSSSKNHNRLNPGIAKSATTRDDHREAVTPLTNNKNSRNDHSTATTTAAAANTPPMEASISPEIHSSLTTPVPATGHHHVHTAISGITDNRKCRPRGLLLAAAATTDTLSDEASLPFPSQASMQWLRDSSPDTCGTSNSSNKSANVIRTPTSADSETLLPKTSQFGSLLDSINFSFEFDTNTDTSSSVDLTRFRAPQLLRDSLCSNDADGGDQFDECCRCLSEDEDPGFVFEDIVAQENKEFGSGCCAESMSIDGSGPPLASSKDSDWDFNEQRKDSDWDFNEQR